MPVESKAGSVPSRLRSNLKVPVIVSSPSGYSLVTESARFTIVPYIVTVEPVPESNSAFSAAYCESRVFA